MEDYREIGPPGNGETRKTGASNLAAVRETTRHVRIHASRVIFRGAHMEGLNHVAAFHLRIMFDQLGWMCQPHDCHPRLLRSPTSVRLKIE